MTMRLVQTQNQLAEMASSRQYEFGTHFGPELHAAVPGMVISETAYDPNFHTPDSIAFFSPNELLTGTPQVQQVVPLQPLDVKVVTHHEEGRDNPALAARKLFLGQQIKRAIAESLPGMTDRLYSYHIGSGAGELDWDAELIAADDDPQRTARTAAELCQDGLTFIISDFQRLPLDQVVGNRLPATIGVKANDSSDLALAPSVTRLGGRREISRQKDVQCVNESLTAYHRGLTARLEAAGVNVAPVVFDAQRKGFDIDAADASIADAVRRLSY